MFLRPSFKFGKMVIPNKLLKLDNTFQTVTISKEFNKSVKKFTMTPPEFESIH